MDNQRAIGPFMEYLRTTEIGGREGVNERSKGCEYRVHGEGEEDLGMKPGGERV